MLGTTTMRLVKADVGTTVEASVPSPDGRTRTSSYKVVGAAVFPPDFGAGGLQRGLHSSTARRARPAASPATSSRSNERHPPCRSWGEGAPYQYWADIGLG